MARGVDQLRPAGPSARRYVRKQNKKYGQVNTNAGSPRKGQRYRTVTRPGGDVVHRYEDGTVIGKGVGQGQKKVTPKPRTPARRAPVITQNHLDAIAERAAEKLQFGPAQQQLRHERQVSDQRMANVGQWYDDYKKTIAEASQRQTQATMQIQGQANQAAGNAQKVDQAQLQQQQARQQADAALRGVTPNPQVMDQAQQGASARQAQATAGANLIGAQGANAASRLNTLSVVAGGQGVQARADEGSRRSQIEASGRDLASQRGAFKVKYKQDLADQRRKQELEDRVFGLNVENTRTDNQRMAQSERRQGQKSRHDAMLADKKFKQDQEKFGRDKAKDNYQRTNRLGPYAPNKSGSGSKSPGKGFPKTQATHTQAVAYQDKVGRTFQTYRPYKKKGFNWIYNDILKATGDNKVPQDLAEAIALRAVGKYPSTKTAEKLYTKYGIRIKHKDWPS